jgi:hypothetical protein
MRGQARAAPRTSNVPKRQRNLRTEQQRVSGETRAPHSGDD